MCVCPSSGTSTHRTDYSGLTDKDGLAKFKAAAGDANLAWSSKLAVGYLTTQTAMIASRASATTAASTDVSSDNILPEPRNPQNLPINGLAGDQHEEPAQLKPAGWSPLLPEGRLRIDLVVNEEPKSPDNHGPPARSLCRLHDDTKATTHLLPDYCNGS